MCIRMVCALGIMFFSVVVAGETEWKEERNEDGMVASCKYHKSGYKYCKINLTTQHGVAPLLAINMDAAFLPEWMETFKSAKQVEKVSDTNYVNCIQYNIPYPFRDRESCSRSIITYDAETQLTRLEFKSVPLFKDTLDHENMEFIYGYWTFKPNGKGQTELEYATLVLPGGNLVAELFNLEAVNVPWNTVKNMLRVLDAGKYKGKAIPFLANK